MSDKCEAGFLCYLCRGLIFSQSICCKGMLACLLRGQDLLFMSTGGAVFLNRVGLNNNTQKEHGWLMPIILATWEAEIGRITGQIVCRTLSPKIRAKWTGGMPQAVECL
jgi:hypothetical protein